jgi:hypothetical protein
MSEMGQLRRLARVWIMSGPPPTADATLRLAVVAYGPQGDLDVDAISFASAH